MAAYARSTPSAQAWFAGGERVGYDPKAPALVVAAQEAPHTSERADSRFIEAVSGESEQADCRSAGEPRMNRQALEVFIATLTVFFPATRDPCVIDEFKKLGRSTLIVTETEELPNRPNFPLNSRA